MIPRKKLLEQVRAALKRSRVVAIVGPRQCGKTTLARQVLPTGRTHYFDLEDPAGLSQLDEPMTALRDCRGTVVIDEVQRRPDLFPIIRVLADRRPLPARFLILGSASPHLLRQPSESLAGRIEIITMDGFSFQEVGKEKKQRLWLRGGFPLAFLARTDGDSQAWRKNFIQTFIERDVPQLGIGISPATLLRFWTMVAHYHGAIWNGAELARSLGVSEPAVRRYLDALEGVFMVRQLKPWHANLKKRQVKSPKVYVRDSGILHQLLGIRTLQDLLSHPKSGASWEGFAIEETVKALRPDEVYFWAVHTGAELDMLILKDGKRIGVECKRMDAPRMTPSMRVAVDDLELSRLLVLYPGDRRYRLADRVEVLPLHHVAKGAEVLTKS